MIMVGIWFSAVYTSHHYVLDVLAGILCAITGIALFTWLSEKQSFVKRAIEKYTLNIK
ncbi:PAP2 superfamily protein [compost metagenome]